MSYIIRKRKIEDCEQIEHVTTLAWNQTYKNIVNDNFLKHLINTEKERAEKSKNKFNINKTQIFVLEINNRLYILEEYKGLGYGKKLVIEAIKYLINKNYNKMIIGCLDKNPSNEFYKHIGEELINKRVFSNTGEDLIENVYYFEDITKILNNLELRK